ncbi:MAG: hypothetical protein JRH20_32900 [Deltaproteobacteria bacterium]|nr:hypothetical protein [Deltaproteobacteria bacterium]
MASTMRSRLRIAMVLAFGLLAAPLATAQQGSPHWRGKPASRPASEKTHPDTQPKTSAGAEKSDPKGSNAKKSDAKKTETNAKKLPPRASGPHPLPTKLPQKPNFIIVPLQEEVSLGMAAFVERVTKRLQATDILVLDIKTFGGRVDAAVTIRDALLHARDKGAKTVAYINPRAISAGALISFATDVIVVAPGATMGAATPIQIGEGGKSKPAGEKVVSYMRKEMRATAEARGRNGDIAEAMVDADIAIEGLSAKGKLLTLDGKEALNWGVASFEADNHEALFKGLGYQGTKGQAYSVTEVRWSWAERVAGWLSSAAVSSLLMSIGMLGLMIGLYTGGSPLPLALGGACLSLFFFGHYVVHLAGVEDMLLFGAGLLLLAFEVFIPGHIAPGVLGVLCIIGSLFLGLINFKTIPLDVQWQTGSISAALAAVSASLLATAALGYGVVRMLPHSKFGRPLILTTALEGKATDKSAARAISSRAPRFGWCAVMAFSWW